MGSPLPYFSLLEGTSPRDVGWDEVLYGSYLALLRYYRTRTEKELYEVTGSIRQLQERKERLLTQILSNGRALKHKGSIHYVYEFMKPEELRALIEKKGAPDTVKFSYDTLSKFHSIIHPFASGHSVLAGVSSWESLVRENFPAAARNLIVISSNDVESWADKSVKALKRWGVIVVSSHPWRQRTAVEVIAHVRKSLPGYSLEIVREDVESKYRDRKVIETHYRLSVKDYLIACKLQKNPSIRVSFR
jgi:hypothetical protein